MRGSSTTSASAPTSATCCGTSRGSIARTSTSCSATSRTWASPRSSGRTSARCSSRRRTTRSREQIHVPLGAACARSPTSFTRRTTCCRPAVRCRSVVTIHDCIHLMFPQYLPNRVAYAYARASMWSAAHRSDRILTVSEASKRDILHFFNVPPEKIVGRLQRDRRAVLGRADRRGRSRACASATSSITASCSTSATSSRTRTSCG